MKSTKERDHHTDAAVMLDYVTSGNWELNRPEDTHQRDLLKSLIYRAARGYAIVYPRAAFHSNLRRSWAKSGLMVDWRTDRDVEHHTLCLFCRTNLLTLTNQHRNQISHDMVRRMERHAFECALRGLLHIDDFNFRGWYCPVKGLQRKDT